MYYNISQHTCLKMTTIGEAAIIIPMAIGVGGIVTNVGSNIDDNVFFCQSFDPIHTYYKFDERYNDIIDKILMNPNHGLICNKIPMSEKAFIPGEGKHYYYANMPYSFCEYFSSQILNKVTLYKRIKNGNNAEKITYFCRVNPILYFFAESAFDKLLREIYNPTNDDTIRITSIDASSMEMKLIVKSQILKNPTPIQAEIANHVIENYHKKRNNNNVKIFVSGVRGAGKTYLGKIIKKMLDQSSNGQTCATLFDNFNPRDIGVNVETLILRGASQYNPAIIVINEIDTVMRFVVNDHKQIFDPRVCHAKDKASFNNMMDNIADTKYCIEILTSETNINKLFSEHEDFRSFLRNGRIDYIVEMTKDDFHITAVE